MQIPKLGQHSSIRGGKYYVHYSWYGLKYVPFWQHIISYHIRLLNFVITQSNIMRYRNDTNKYVFINHR